MKTFEIYIDLDGLENFVTRLAIGDKYFAYAVKKSLNTMAFQMKGKSGVRGEIAKEAIRGFQYSRNKTLFRVMTGVVKADGETIADLESKAGLYEAPKKDRIAYELGVHEGGGSIREVFKPLETSRTGKNQSKQVRKINYLQSLNIIDIRNLSNKSEWIKYYYTAKKYNKEIYFRSKNGNEYIARPKPSKLNRFKKELLYLRKPDETVNVEDTPYITIAGEKVFKRFDTIFDKEIDKAINKILIK